MLKLLHDGLLWISEGRNRKELSWKNKEISWHDLILRLSKSVSTSETLAEYIAFPKDIQAEKKDVGGFVGGLISGGRRKAGAVTARYLLTLDIEGPDVTIDFWSDFSLQFDNAAFLYGTHRNSPAAPHLRLVMPLSRECFPDEYQAISRKVAEILGIDLFDPTTFQPERLMYWGSTPKDVAFYTERQDGPFIDVDAILALYRDWKDVSQWAVGTRAKTAIQRSKDKQGDPLSKPGIIGAFCRTYSITEAIEAYLKDVYISTDDADRFTFVGGSTAAGLVVYDDLFAYSHHGTDPISGKLCNSFDLVRLHLYGKMDDDAKSGTPVNKTPSHLAMEFLAYESEGVIQDLNTVALIKRNKDFDKEDEGNKKLIASLESNKQGIITTINNAYLLLQNDPNLKNCFAFNELDKKEVVLRDLPWRTISKSGEAMTETDDACLRGYLEKNFGISGPTKIADAFRHIVNDNSFHPIRDYLSNLKWDRESRLDRLFINYLGADDTAYTQAVTRKAIVAAVARVYQPGIKFDYATVLVGSQGLGKSTLINKLGGEWFSDSFIGVKGKEAYEQLQGVWLMEIGELAGFRKSEVETIKLFIGKRIDRFRVAFGKRLEDFPRQCVFFGTTNDEQFLSDATGNRRFWPVTCDILQVQKSIWEDLTHYEVNQIWAEAVCFYRNGEKLYLDPSLEATAETIQSRHLEYDDRQDLIAAYLEKPIEDDETLLTEGTVYRNKVSVAEIWVNALNGKRSDMTRYNTKPIHNIMARLKDWEKIEITIWDSAFGAQRGYKRLIDKT